MRNKTNILLLLITLFAAVVRVYNLSSIPALNADEAAIGYNAYSLLKTGLDEHSNPWPIHFQSFNDYKPGLYFYIVMPFVHFLGLNEMSVRLPGALISTAAIPLIYALALTLTKNNKTALLSSLLLAISPWHIQFSRGGWEVSVATTFILLGVTLFLNIAKNKHFLLLSGLSFLASLYTYHSARIVVPLLLVGLSFASSKLLIKMGRQVVISLVVCGLLVFPLAKDMFGPAVISRASGVGLFADSGPLSRVNEQRGEHSNNYRSLPTKLIHNKLINYSLAFVQNYGDHFHGEFLFLSGDDIQRNKVPETGQLHIFELVSVSIGLIVLAKNHKKYRPILLWLLVAPTAAALTFQSPHALRSHNMVIPLTIISALGLNYILEVVNKTKHQKHLLPIIFAVIFLFFARYIHMYYIHMAKEYPYSSQYGVKELVNWIRDNSDKYKKIIITDRYDQPYILTLFYLKYPPELFQKDHTLTAKDIYGFSTVRRFDKFEFASINFDEARPNNSNAAIIGTDEEIPDEANIVKQIYGSNGKLYFQIVGN